MRELSLHILDLVQNSVEAGARYVFVSVEEDNVKDTFSIKIQDDGRGMDKELLDAIKDPFITTRTTRNIGMGLPLIDMSTKRTGGTLEISSKKGKGTTVYAVYKASHIDRPPLGDIIGTLKVIVISYQQIRFIYEQKKGDKTFYFDTKEIREVLGNEADFGATVFQEWLNGYLEELRAF